jgi:hypothetical protein
MMTEVTTGCAKSHASETRAALHPCARKIYDDLLLGISKAEDRQGVVAEQ